MLQLTSLKYVLKDLVVTLWCTECGKYVNPTMEVNMKSDGSIVMFCPKEHFQPVLFGSIKFIDPTSKRHKSYCSMQSMPVDECPTCRKG